MIRFSIILLLLFVTVRTTVAQTQDRQLADQYFADGEYSKAAMYYEKLYDDTDQPFYLKRLALCRFNVEDYDVAESLLKKASRKMPNDLDLLITLGQAYKRQDDNRRAENTWDDVINGLGNNRSEIINVADKFTKIGEYQYALQAYEKGKKNIRGFYVFNSRIAELYGQMGQNDKMIELYLELIEKNPSYQRSVQVRLSRIIDFEEDQMIVETLRQELLKKVQDNPDKPIFAEMLIWMFLQQSDFYGAYAQAKALDRRLDENGSRLMSLANVARNNKKFDVARDALKYVVKKGKKNQYYDRALQEYLTVSKLHLDFDPQTATERYAQLKDEYLDAISQWSEPNLVAASSIELAEIEAYQLNDLDTAISRLENNLENLTMSDRNVALTKIKLGDFLVVKNQVWDAALYYMQAEKAFKYDELGDKAKFKAAKIYYYTGEFDYARSQLDVLKGSTSKLIANDAMYLSNLINDNTIIDTTFKPMEMFARADLLLEQKKYAEAFATLDSIDSEYPGHSLQDDILMKRFELNKKMGQFQESAQDLEKLIENHGDDILGDDAHFKLAELYEHHLNNEDRARELYQKILTDYSGSLYVVEARKRFRKLRGDSTTEEL
ncbi:tetratricopeptide repeat protein [Salibacter halophilus]|uniref:Tetratricopeptide repeat protein n=1 Tax=Salibacter halophilus TaxID=1803916 RepID=A0A6N6M2F1_9FLAO|nr:tetratricopeptide repeat protein [Salibacter halophilus]KAB1063362.1 tetratricopeptide repeat protein [Salibacter halophilus]